MAEYNLYVKEKNSFYSLKDEYDIFREEMYEESEAESFKKEFINKVSNYLGEYNLENIISITDIDEMQCQEDYDTFVKTYFKNITKEPFITEWYTAHAGVTNEGDKFIQAESGGWFFIYYTTREVLNKYINKK